MMAYIKTVLVGVAGSLAAVLIWVVSVLLWEIGRPVLIDRISGPGGFPAGGSIRSSSVLLAALIGFVIGAIWEGRRLMLI